MNVKLSMLINGPILVTSSMTEYLIKKKLRVEKLISALSFRGSHSTTAGRHSGVHGGKRERAWWPCSHPDGLGSREETELGPRLLKTLPSDLFPPARLYS